MSIAVRQLGAHDLAAMRNLNRMFAAAFEDLDCYERAPPSDAYLAQALAREANIVLTAQSDDDVVGGLVAYLFEKFEQERCLGGLCSS